MKSCFMFGHSDCPSNILPNIVEAIEKLYLMGVTNFYVGSRGQFDHVAASAVKRLKHKHTDIRLFLVLSYHPAERPFCLWDGFDGSYYPPIENVPRPYAIVRSNQYMIIHSDYLLCYVKHIGNTKNFLDYAQKHKAENQIVNVALPQGKNVPL